MSYEAKHFKKGEFFNYDKMNVELLKKLDLLKEKLNTTVIVTSSNNPAQEHSDKSQHYLNNAVDVVFPKWTGKLGDMLDAIDQCGFTGIGVYPHWSYNGKKIGGFHLDVRPTKVVARWMGVKINGVQKYIQWNDQNLKKYSIIE